ncbi:MAG: 1-deoxy-D-xylulose-5-phosphate reductoisomerase [Candidatus Zixiibacteriota bacterium]
MATPKPIGIIGSTGSIGESTLRVVDRHRDRLRVVALAAGRNVARLAEQAERYRPEAVAVADAKCVDELRARLRGKLATEILAGGEGIAAIAAWTGVATVVVAVVGFAGVRPTLAAITAGKNVALANKETLVAAGAVVMPLARKHGAAISPIDSEHSAIWQCLRAGRREEVRRLILTASGGPFRTRPLSTFGQITPDEALAHPTWSMGPRITIDSATMMNKGFEILEASWLFDVDPACVDVVIHPQSIVHSLVEFHDGSSVAQMGVPDMTLPIAYALFAPERVESAPDLHPFDLASSGPLEFMPPEAERYPALDLARRAGIVGGTAGAVLNAADEVAVAAFLDHRLPFTGIVSLVQAVLDEHDVVFDPGFDDIVSADRWARARAEQHLGMSRR